MKITLIVLAGITITCSNLEAMGIQEKKLDLSAKEWDGYKYDDSIQQKLVIQLITSYDLKTLFRETHCLDFGCGQGGVTSLFKALTKITSIHGIDPSPSMIELAQEMYDSENITFEQTSAEKLTDQSFYDGVVSFFTLHWIEDKKLVFNNAFEALKPGGCFFATCDTPHASENEKYVIGTLMQEFPSFKEVFTSKAATNDLLGRYHGTPEEIKKLLTASGFIDIAVQSHDFALEFSQEEFSDFQKAQVLSRPFMNNISQEQHELIFKRFVELVRENLQKTKEGKVIYPYKMLTMMAFKSDQF